MTDTNYADDLTFLEHINAQAEFLMQCLQQAVRGIGLCVNANKTDIICFKREGAKSLKYFGRNIN